MITGSIALMIYGDIHSGSNALMEEKYKDLAAAFSSQEFKVESVLYNDESVDKLAIELLKFNAVLVWVNPVEQGNDRKKLDLLLTEVSGKGCFVSTHPEVILKMGTKDVLYKTKEMDWSDDIKMYTSFEDFSNRFPESLQTSQIRVLKQYRGNGGNGVYKVVYSSAGEIKLTHAAAGSGERKLSVSDFYTEFKPFFLNDGLLIDQEWNKNIVNGMVRCYLSGTKVVGFGYQEINALYELNGNIHIPPGKRYYYTEHCGLFSDLKEVMENKWVPELQNSLSIARNMMPVIWDADFFINKANSKNAKEKYSLCEINVSCVSPFPPSAIKFIVDEVRNRIK
jgi:hypothetical protein